jgi:ParB family chromosome partitioning protein
MVKKQNHLNKGLVQIWGDDFTSVLEDIQQGNVDIGASKLEIPIDEIRANPYQPRKEFEEESLRELSESIKRHGVFQPILVRKSIQGYDLVAGERRLRASKLAGLETIPAIVTEFNDEQMMEISLLENIQRENLNIVEEAYAYQRLIDKLEYTQSELAERVSKSRVHVTNTLRLLKLPQTILDYLKEERLSMGHARCLITVEDEDEAILLANEIIAKKLSVREAEKLVKKSNTSQTKNSKKVKDQDPYLKNVQNMIQSKLQTKVDVSKNSIIIKYMDVSDLNRILEVLDCIED